MLYHDSRSTLYRSPAGAVPCKTPVTLRFQGEDDTWQVTLRVWWDGREWLYPMSLYEEGLWTATLPMPETPGVLWYHFIITSPEGTKWYGNAGDNMGGRGETYLHEPPGFQVTVYQEDYQTPDWMRGGIVYQIMVDRFYASKPLKDRTKPQDGWLHENWDEPPEIKLKGEDREANDFFGGDLKGVEKKLPYLKDLGVSILYLNPIFRARSNHKYDTGDYMQVDPSFGSEEDLRSLCEKARHLGIRVMLDGVFNHTGSDSRYFNMRGTYDSIGAYQSKNSPYASWYQFKHWPDTYECWWGFDTLPDVNEMDDSYLDFIIRGKDAVCAHYLRSGTSGWRLDVADELPMDFLRLMRQRVKQETPDACLLGEVWEDASNKTAYGEQRCYCLGDTLDSVMNYPLRDISLGFMLGSLSAAGFIRQYRHLQENYAPMFFYSLMNLLGSHDKPRIIDVLSGAEDTEPPREQRRARHLSPNQYALGKRRYMSLWRFICALPGMPCIYYADEAGQTGMADPFCRGTYPWGREDKWLIQEIREACHQRNKLEPLRTGEIRLYAPTMDVLVAARRIHGGKDVFGNAAKNGLVVCALNRSFVEMRLRLQADDMLPVPLDIELEPIGARTIVVEA